jgi:hypothetical protein
VSRHELGQFGATGLRVELGRISLICQRMYQAEHATPLLGILNAPIWCDELTDVLSTRIARGRGYPHFPNHRLSVDSSRCFEVRQRRNPL